MNMTIVKILEKLIGHKVTLRYTPHEETELRETSGILKEIDTNIISLETYDVYGNLETWYLNRHACTLHSVVDEGVK